MVSNKLAQRLGRARDAHGPAEPVADLLDNLADDGWSNGLQATYRELRDRLWREGTVYEASALALPVLVRIAGAQKREHDCEADEDDLNEARAGLALALVLLVATGQPADAAAKRALDEERATLVERLERIAHRSYFAERAAKLARDRTKRIMGFVKRAEEALELLLDAPVLTLEQRIAACTFGDDDAEFKAVRVIHECLKAGRNADVLSLCAQLRLLARRWDAEPDRLVALAALGRTAEARDGAVALARAFLEPPSEPLPVLLCQSEVLRPLRRLLQEGPDAELEALQKRVAAWPA